MDEIIQAELFFLLTPGHHNVNRNHLQLTCVSNHNCATALGPELYCLTSQTTKHTRSERQSGWSVLLPTHHFNQGYDRMTLYSYTPYAPSRHGASIKDNTINIILLDCSTLKLKAIQSKWYFRDQYNATKWQTNQYNYNFIWCSDWRKCRPFKC
jgi:hypothetical protein